MKWTLNIKHVLLSIYVKQMGSPIISALLNK